MKTVKKSGRLQLNRESLRTLGESELDQVAGATTAPCAIVISVLPRSTQREDVLCGTNWSVILGGLNKK